MIDGWKFARPESVALGAMDADFSHDVNVLPKMVAALEEGIRLGGRQPLRRGRRHHQLAAAPNHHVAGRVLARAAADGRQGRHQRILSGPARGYRRRTQLDPIGFKIGLEVIVKGKYGKAVEVPYVFTDRVVGESKLDQKEIFNYLKQLRKLYSARLLPKSRELDRANADAGLAAQPPQ